MKLVVKLSGTLLSCCGDLTSVRTLQHRVVSIVVGTFVSVADFFFIPGSDRFSVCGIRHFVYIPFDFVNLS